MSSRGSYILLAFANPLQVPSEYLPALTRESSRVFKHLQRYDLEDKCDVNRIPEATVEQLFDLVEEWHKRKDLVLFHYGGHASGESLLLNTEEAGSTKTHAEGLARLLGSLSKLQLVFLNGCSTKGQVDLLLKKGVKAVIATSMPIHDKTAVDFADRFYKNLSEGETVGMSFDRARDFILSKHDQKVLSSEETRSLLWEEADSESEDLPWGIYYKEDNIDVLKWTLPQDVEQKQRFGDVDKYTCDRAEQNSIFKTRFLTNFGEKKIQTYFIHGEEKQSPKGLFNRFVMEHIGNAYQNPFHKVALMEEATELEGAKINLLTALFDAVELKHAGRKRAELTLETVSKSPVLRNIDCVAVKFRVYSSAWKPFTGDFIQWFLSEFGQVKNLAPTAPDFIFFFSVIYEESAQGGFFNRLFKSSPKAKILKTMQQFDEISVLKELPPVLQPDIRKWFDRIEVEDALEKDEQMAKYFPDQEVWEMVLVERKLAKIIDFYNERNM